jgi:hypothetical protein
MRYRGSGSVEGGRDAILARYELTGAEGNHCRSDTVFQELRKGD